MTSSPSFWELKLKIQTECFKAFLRKLIKKRDANENSMKIKNRKFIAFIVVFLFIRRDIAEKLDIHSQSSAEQKKRIWKRKLFLKWGKRSYGNRTNISCYSLLKLFLRQKKESTRKERMIFKSSKIFMIRNCNWRWGNLEQIAKCFTSLIHGWSYFRNENKGEARVRGEIGVKWIIKKFLIYNKF